MELNILFYSVDEQEKEREIPVAAHARRASAHVANRFLQSPTIPLSDAQTERGTNVLRRLSLSSAAFVKVSTSPSSHLRLCR